MEIDINVKTKKNTYIWPVSQNYLNLPKTVIRFLTSSVWNDGFAEASQLYNPDVNKVTSRKITDIPVTSFPVPSRVIFWNK